jgi:adenylosuccinate lyase
VHTQLHLLTIETCESFVLLDNYGPAINSMLNWLSIQVNELRLAEDLEQTWEVLAEPIQTVRLILLILL